MSTKEKTEKELEKERIAEEKRISSLKVLSIDDIFSSNDLKTVKVEIPQWGGAIFVRIMTGKERDEFEHRMLKRQKTLNFKGMRAYLITTCVVDKDGNKLFQDDEKTRGSIEAKAGAALDIITEEIMKINHISGTDVQNLVGN